MLNIRDLERRWLQHKVKNYYPHLFSFIVLLLAVLIFLIFFNQASFKTDLLSSSSLNESNVKSELQKSISPIKEGAKSPLTQEAASQPKSIIKSTPAESKQVINQEEYQPKKLQPSFSFMSTINSYEAQSPKPKPQKQQINTSITPAVEKEIKTISQPIAKEPAKLKVTAKTEINAPIPNGIKINRIKSHEEIQDIVRRFEKSKTPVLGLYLARYYYKTQNYQKSYNYALRTNDINPNIEESWLIFASSQIKLSQKDEAIKTLIAYIKSSDSMNAKSLLRSIRNGKFR